MDAQTYNRLREAANDESLSYGEIMEIEAAFDLLPDDKLRDRRENAMADDMLDEIASHLIGCGKHRVFVTDDMLIPACDLCGGPQYAEGDDWNGETGQHFSCEERKGPAGRTARIDLTEEELRYLLALVAYDLEKGATWSEQEAGLVDTVERKLDIALLVEFDQA